MYPLARVLARGLAVPGLSEAGGNNDTQLSDHPLLNGYQTPCGEGPALPRPPWPIRIQTLSSLLPSLPRF